MANLRIATENRVDSGSLDASPTLESNLPVENLLDPRRAFVARSTSTADQAITGGLVVDADSGVVTNGNFESDTSGWIAHSTASVAQSTAETKFGAGSMEITAGSSNGIDRASHSLNLPYYRAGTQLALSFWVKAASGSALQLVRWFYTSGGANPDAHLLTIPSISITDQWQQVTALGVLDYDDRTAVRLHIGYESDGQAIGDKLYVDGVQVHIGSQNPPFYPVIKFALLWATNLTHQAMWRLSLSKDATYGAGAGEVYNSGWVAHHDLGLFDHWAANRRFTVLYFAGVDNAQSFQVEISDPNNPDGYMQIGELWLGEYTELTKQILHGFSHTADGGAKTITPPGGGSYSTQPYTGGPVRQLQAEAQLTSQADRNAWATFKRQCGSGSPVWIDVFPTDSDDQQHIDHAMLGFVESREPLVNRVRSIYRSKITITES